MQTQKSLLWILPDELAFAEALTESATRSVSSHTLLKTISKIHKFTVWFDFSHDYMIAKAIMGEKNNY